MTLTTAENVATYMGTSVNTVDFPDSVGVSTEYTTPQITLAIKSASGIIESYCNRIFHETMYTELHKCAGSINLKQYPISMVLSVNWGDTQATTDTPITDINTNDSAGILEQDSYNYGWLKVDYTAGYPTIPADLEQIAIEITSALLQNASVNPLLASEKIGDYQYNKAVTLSDFMVPWYPRLSPYRKGNI